ncbi:MAG: acetate--CoA ligase family protein [Deltaproteobacteria bacterium]|nr:acetate--CoA ligase family protein [Deltaproteobacteria bacterium]
MDKVFNPASIAIIGLSSKPNNIPRLTLENMLRWGYRGRIFGVNPRSEDTYVDGIRMYKEIEGLPEAPDLVYALIPAKFVPEMIERCGKIGVKRMAIPSGGFNEFGDQGHSLAELALQKAREYGIRFVGPNGLTVANTSNGLCFPFAPLIKPPRGGISIISQSGGIGLMIINFLKDENLGMAKFASIGNKLDLNEVDFLTYFGQDAETTIIFMYLESISDGLGLVRAARKIHKPIVIYKANTTDSGSKAAMSHTAAISNDDDIIESVFEQSGIIRIHHFYDFLAIAKAFQLPPLKGNRIMVMSPAGGVSVMMADLCEKAGFAFADPGEAFYRGLQSYSNAGVIRFSNPLDMGDIYDPRLIAHVICSVMHSDQVDGAFYVSFTPRFPPGESVFRTLFRTDLSTEAWGTILSSGKPLGSCLASPGLSNFKQAINVPIFNSPEELVRAMSLQMKYHLHASAPRPAAERPTDIESDAARQWVRKHGGSTGEEALELLAHYGIPTVASYSARGQVEAVALAEKVGYPVVMKVISKDALHKSDVEGVIVGLADEQQVKEAFVSIRSNLFRHKPDASFEGVRIQPMAGGGHDLFIGGKHDASFGPIIIFGLGGIFIELFRDTANLLCPASKRAIRDRLKLLKAHKLLQGIRGQSEGDVDSFVHIIQRVSLLMADFPQIRELDINPLRVFAKGALALDVRLRIE